MKVQIKINEYQEEQGIRLEWEDNFEIACLIEGDTINIKANNEGLFSLAKHLLTLAQNKIPTGRHLHFDDINSLEEGSATLIIEKI
ncbi:Imm32 family immunity protein [Paenibacillus wulumuqiensis]|uniref:Imm32 family immunity protein n=1 Tax=Paenibacillus wulumuqiensis TaxID=1567107 RepID=UPI000619C517|nr:hypothetical protein [Paenibacillus wulumuqiensis]